MKKILSLASVIVGLTSSAVLAGTSVDWYCLFGMYPNGASDLQSGDAGTGVAASQAVIWQLVYTGTDNQIDLVDADNVAGGYAYDDDVVLQTRSIPAGGGAYGEWLYAPAGTLAAFESSTTYTGLFYARVIGTSSPVIGSWYYNSPTIVAANIDITDPGRSPQLLDTNVNGGSQGDALNLQIVAVPEPSSMALLALGLGVVALRRKFRK